ncbi:MAG: flavoprotein, partial [Chloroflexota bacterium]|nr:flavoprotein [Chloroflexota bacterium]
TSLRIAEVRRTADGLVLMGEDGEMLGPVDEIVCATGFRPDLSISRELRLDLDAAVEAPSALAPLIDPNIHSCGSVPPHGAEQLKHPESDFYTVGMKSYGRAPTFLLLTGYEQVRSVVAAIAGDWESARDVELVLPETGVCSTSAGEGSSCCASELHVISLDLGVSNSLPVLQPVGAAVTAQPSCCGSTAPCCR